MPAVRRQRRCPRTLFQDLPIDILSPILSHLDNRRDWHSCSLVNKIFNEISTPYLYMKLDSRIISKGIVYHPSSTLLLRPHLAQYVHKVTETGAVHRGYPDITRDTLTSLPLCTNLRSMTWIDDSPATDSTLLKFLDVVRKLPLRELTIRTHSDLGETVWSQLVTLTGLQKVSIWCMEGPPRVLQGWSEPLGTTLTHLELGRCAGVPPTILITVLSQLPLLQDLRLKGAPASAIATILSFLPNLRSLDTEYHSTGNSSYRRAVVSPTPTSGDGLQSLPLPVLRHLTLRTSSIDNLGPIRLWGWIQDIVPRAGLETFRLLAFSINGDSGIPRMFILDLASKHSASLKHFMVGDSYLTLMDIECLCSKFPMLETLVCSVANSDVPSIVEAIATAKNLQTLKLQVRGHPMGFHHRQSFSRQDAADIMLRKENPKLRTVAIGRSQYTGRWVLKVGHNDKPKIHFEVTADVVDDTWHA
ncbi:hypothetical protein CPB83DRAFT_798739 [Crepidotus variabilis]|uniref:F-box domain-containing protein n=1 Tax=Crepidotus variabilis TaxID=179855 RepID=A0A9P6E725_9AGAR|nr:hypothetical protein CPB83DRAFT_798739 [Crepidotus variabilis]